MPSDACYLICTQRNDEHSRKASQSTQHPTSLSEQERQRAEQEKQRAEQAELELEQERISRQRLVQKLKELGVNPENL